MNKLKLQRQFLHKDLIDSDLIDEIKNPELVQLIRRLKKCGHIKGGTEVYEVLQVVGSVTPYVGQFLSKNRVTDMCATDIWQITFV
jgi:hypothetical protein